MAFKIPLPVVGAKLQRRAQLPASDCIHLNLPSFQKKDFTDLVLIGQGSFGKVFRARKSDVLYVIKELADPNASMAEKRMFIKEAEMLKSVLGHENVVQIRGFSSTDCSILMDFVSFSFNKLGMELDSVSTLKGFLTSCDSVNDFSGFEHLQYFIAIDVCQGLQFLHSKNIVHRDLKPDNILVSNSHYSTCEEADIPCWWATKPVRALLTDFGESRSTVLQTRSVFCTSTAHLQRGSPAFMAPEALANNGNRADIEALKKIDIWALGMVFYCLVNPNSQYPYASEMDAMHIPVDRIKVLRDMHAAKQLPQHLEKYRSNHSGSWKPLTRMFSMCTKFTAGDRPAAHEAFRGIINEHVHVNPLVVSQSTVTEVVDNEIAFGHRPTTGTVDGTENACTFLALLIADKVLKGVSMVIDEIATDAILNFPTAVNERRSADRMYCVDEAYAILRETRSCDAHEFELPTSCTTATRVSVAQEQLCVGIHSILATMDEVTPFCAIYTCPPYTLLFCRQPGGLLTVVDTHTLSERYHGANTAATVTAAENVSALCNWVFYRMDMFAKDMIRHELAVLRPVPVNAASMHSEQCTIVDEGQNAGVVRCPSLDMTVNNNFNAVCHADVHVSDISLSNKCPPSSVVCNNLVASLNNVKQCLVDVDEGGNACGVPCPNLDNTFNMNATCHANVQDINIGFSKSCAPCAAVVCSKHSVDDKTDDHDVSCQETDDALSYYHNSAVSMSDNEECSDSTLNPDCLSASDSVDADESCAESSCTRKSTKGSNRWHQTELDISNWDDCPVETVTELPFNIDGMCKFTIHCEQQDMMKQTKDGRPWRKWHSSSRKGLRGVRRVTRCQGSLTCKSQSCMFLQQHGFANRSHFEKHSGLTECFTCRVPAERIECPAVKIWEYDSVLKVATVYHDGYHSCNVKSMIKKPTKQEVLKVIRCHPTVKPNRLVNGEMVNLMSTDNFDWTEVETLAEQLADVKRIQNFRDKLKRQTNPVGENFEAIAYFRKKCAEKDECLIYSVNSRDLNGSPSYVFKSSVGMARLALLMDKDGNEILCNEYAHFDATHTRCRDFKSITLWTYHPVMRKLLRIAIMEVESENTENLTKFWELLNEMMIKLFGKKFNPVGFVADEHHANWLSIRTVFGSEALERVVSCEFHFRQSVQRQSKRLECPEAELFIARAEHLLTAATIIQFERACTDMNEFIGEHPTVSDWYNWWYKRRTHIFRAFKSPDAPTTNLAEVGHAKLGSVGRRYMSLLEAAREDVAGAIRQDTEIKMFDQGQIKSGRGVDNNQRKAQLYQNEMKRAKAYGEEIDAGLRHDNTTVFVPHTGLHRPPQKRLRIDKLRTGVVAQGKLKKAAMMLTTSVAKKHHSSAVKSSKAKLTSASAARTAVAFHVAFFNNIQNLKKCYGCGTVFKPVMKKPPRDLVLKHFCHRRYKNRDGNEAVSPVRQAVYCHLNLDCARKIEESMEISDIIVHVEVKQNLSAAHKQLLTDFGIHLATD